MIGDKKSLETGGFGLLAASQHRLYQSKGLKKDKEIIFKTVETDRSRFDEILMLSLGEKLSGAQRSPSLGGGSEI